MTCEYCGCNCTDETENDGLGSKSRLITDSFDNVIKLTMERSEPEDLLGLPIRETP